MKAAFEPDQKKSRRVCRRRRVLSMYKNADNPILNSTILNYRTLPFAILPTSDPFAAMRGIEPVAVIMPFEFLDNGDVVFNVCAMDAETVEVEGKSGAHWSDGRHALENKGSGWFRGVVSGIPAGFQYMQYYFDGKPVLYEHAPIGWGYGYAVNYIDKPDPELDFYLMKHVPHGTIRYETYYSDYTKDMRSCWVYTPPSYDTNPEKTYPTLYIQHGAGENESGWFWQGKLNYILDNLIAEGKAEEMIIVSNSGYATPASPDSSNAFFSDLAPLLINDCIPFIEKRFRARQGKAYRALAGLSMGAIQAQTICYTHPESFDYIGIFSGVTGVELPDVEQRMFFKFLDYEQFYGNPEVFNAQHKLLYFGKGSDEGGDLLPREIAVLRGRGVTCEYYVCDGVHEWQVWRKTAHDFLPRLFR